jgi:hypothetical protein
MNISKWHKWERSQELKIDLGGLSGIELVK